MSNLILVQELICITLFEILDMFGTKSDHNIIDMFLRLFQNRLCICWNTIYPRSFDELVKPFLVDLVSVWKYLRLLTLSIFKRGTLCCILHVEISRKTNAFQKFHFQSYRKDGRKVAYFVTTQHYSLACTHHSRHGHFSSNCHIRHMHAENHHYSNFLGQSWATTLNIFY